MHDHMGVPESTVVPTNRDQSTHAPNKPSQATMWLQPLSAPNVDPNSIQHMYRYYDSVRFHSQPNTFESDHTVLSNRVNTCTHNHGESEHTAVPTTKIRPCCASQHHAHLRRGGQGGQKKKSQIPNTESIQETVHGTLTSRSPYWSTSDPSHWHGER